MNISIKLINSDSDISKQILEHMLPSVNKFMIKIIRKLKNTIPTLIEAAIRNSPEYESVLAGQLRYEFGIPNPSEKLSTIISIWINSMQFNYDKPSISNNKIKSSLGINMIKSDFSDVLSTEASLVKDNTKGYSLPWLQWLLLDGSKTIVPKYQVLFGQNKNSRTGFAVMTPSNRSWKVPQTYSGTINDNWITRSIDRASPDIQALIAGALSDA